jgi:hypothetical protein
MASSCSTYPIGYETNQKNINQNPIVRMVKKVKPKYCENSNMFSGILNVNTKITLLFFLAIKIQFS